MFYVYILKSEKDGTHYIGYTSKEPKERLREHNLGRNRYTKGHRPYKLLTYKGVDTKKEAKGLERYLKRLKDIKRAIEMIKGSPD